MIAAIVLWAASVAGFCQEQKAIVSSKEKVLPEYIQEFFLSDTVRTQERGEIQITLGWSDWDNLGREGFFKTEYGLTNRLQLVSELSYGSRREQIGAHTCEFNDVKVGIGYEIIRGHSTFGLIGSITAAMPTGQHEGLDWQPAIAAAKSFGKLQVHASIEAEIEKLRRSYEYSLASVWPITRNWYPTLEFKAQAEREGNVYYLAPGLYRRLSHRMEIGVGLPFGLSSSSSGAGIVLKVNMEFDPHGDRR